MAQPNWILDFVIWHEERILSIGYPREVQEELRRARLKWFSGIKTRRFV
jgi:hypothetical protein